MTGQNYFILGMTFITGMFAGAYLYVTAFAPSYQQDDVQEVSTIEFQLQGEEYGGCQMAGSCSTFTLEANRKYIFETPAGRIAGEDVVVKGKLSKETQQELLTAIEIAQWDTLVKKDGRSCASYTDGIDYRYLLIYKGEQVSLDTCGTAFGDTLIAESFAQLWGGLRNPAKEKYSNDDLSDILHERFRGAQ